MGLLAAPDHMKVKSHTDCKDILKKLLSFTDTGEFTDETTISERQLITKISIKAARHPEVIFNYAHETKAKEPNSLTRYYMTLAHNASVDGSGANTKLKVPDPFEANESSTWSSMLNNFTTAMEIIDFEEARTTEGAVVEIDFQDPMAIIDHKKDTGPSFF